MTLKKMSVNNIFLLICVVLFGCSSPEYTQTKKFENAEWHINDTAFFEFSTTNIQKSRNIFIELSHEDDYEYGNIYLFCDINFPDGKIIKDTIQYILINQNYEWVGDGMSTKSLKFPYKQNVSFPEEGQYLFKINQAMRVGQDSSLYGINNITLTIE